MAFVWISDSYRVSGLELGFVVGCIRPYTSVRKCFLSHNVGPAACLSDFV